LYDPEILQWYTGTGWSATLASANIITLTADDVGDPDFDRYSGTTGAWPSGDYLVEYYDSTGAVINEERLALTMVEEITASARGVWDYEIRLLTDKSGIRIKRS